MLASALKAYDEVFCYGKLPDEYRFEKLDYEALNTKIQKLSEPLDIKQEIELFEIVSETKSPSKQQLSMEFSQANQSRNNVVNYF